MMLEAYFDESGRESGVFCVAGYAFTPQQARLFNKEWRDLLGTRTFHMKDLAAKQGQFEGLERVETHQLLKEAVKIINKRVSFGTAGSCYLSEIKANSPQWIKGFGHAYPICCHLAMSCIGDWLRRTSNQNITTLSYDEVKDIKPSLLLDLSKGGSWHARENDVSQHLTCVAFIAWVRKSDGGGWTMDNQAIKSKVEELKLKLSNEALSPSKETK